MAEYVRRETTTRRVEFRLPSPCSPAEYAKAYVAAASEVTGAGREIYDDTIAVTGTGDEIVVSYEEDADLAGELQRQADLVAELGRQARAVLCRYRTPVGREPSTEAAEAAESAHRDLAEVVERLIQFGGVVRDGGRP